MGDRGICIAEILPSALPLANPFFDLWAGTGQSWEGDAGGQGAGGQAPLAPLSRGSRGGRACSSEEAS